MDIMKAHARTKKQVKLHMIINSDSQQCDWVNSTGYSVAELEGGAYLSISLTTSYTSNMSPLPFQVDLSSANLFFK